MRVGSPAGPVLLSLLTAVRRPLALLAVGGATCCGAVSVAQPSAPYGFFVRAMDEGALLHWQDLAFERYEYRFGHGEVPEFNAWAEAPAVLAGWSRTLRVDGLANGTRYTFEVRGVNGSDVGPAAMASTRLAASPSSTVEVRDAELSRFLEESLDGEITQGRLAGLRTLSADAIGCADVTGLELALNLATLDLSGNEIADISPLAGLTALNTLDLSGNDIADVSPLAGLAALSTLYLSGNEVADVSPLAGLAALSTLYLSGNEVADVSPLAGLAALSTLYLSGNEVADVSPLAGLAALSTLYLSGNEIVDVSPLSGLGSLRHLLLGRNEIVDIPSLPGLTSLRHLDLSGNRVVTVSPLSRLTSLSTLDLSGNHIVDVSPLSGLGSLRHLLLGHNKIADVRPLSGLASLVHLDLSDNRLVDISPLSSLTRLSRLNLAGNAIADIRPLSILPRLVDLYLFDNEISDIAPLSLLPRALWSLDLSGNRIVDVSALQPHSIGNLGLQILNLSGNEIANISPLGSMTSLSVLYLSENAISDVGRLAGLPGLAYLALSGNTISNIAPLGRMKWLHTLLLNDNAISDLSPLLDSDLSHTDNWVRDGLASDPFVDLRGNPVGRSQIDYVSALREAGLNVMVDDGGLRVPLFPAADSSAKGFVRVINHSTDAGAVSIEAVDETGERRAPVAVAIGANEALHFNAEDLEQGNSAKGLRGVGEGVGDWRLVLRSELDIEVLSYARTADGFVTSLHDLAAEADGTSVIPTVNPGSNRRQVSRLRLVNPAARDTAAEVEMRDDAGEEFWSRISIPSGRTLDLTSAEVESGYQWLDRDLDGYYDRGDGQDFAEVGDGAGKWRLTVHAPGQRVMSLVQSPTGHLTNISTGTAAFASPTSFTRGRRPLGHPPTFASRVRQHYSWERGGTIRVPLFVAASSTIQGFLRIANLHTAAAAVSIRAFDSSGEEYGPVRLTLRGGESFHLNANDLESGNRTKGLRGIGRGRGDWHLEVSADRRFEVLAYARTADGFLTSLHDVAPRMADGSLWIPFFNPGSNRRQASRLRLVNWSEEAVEAVVRGVDDAGNASGVVRLTVPERAARDYLAWELEAGSGAGLSGTLGDGRGKWRLQAAASPDVQTMSLLALSSGHVTNLSTTPRYPRD